MKHRARITSNTRTYWRGFYIANFNKKQTAQAEHIALWYCFLVEAFGND